MSIRTLNPVLDLELRQRSRSLRSTVVLSLFLLLLIGVLFLAYEGAAATARHGFDPLQALTVRAGRTMFEWVVAAEVCILFFIVPAISASSVAGERSRQTLIPLQVTLVRPRQIYAGKVMASSAFVLLLLLASAPVLAVPYLLGGVRLSQVLLSLFSLLVIGVLLAMIGVACSSYFRRTQAATLAAYAAMLVLTIGTVVAMGTLALIDDSRGNDVVELRRAALYPNPFAAVADASGDVSSSADGPFTPLKRVLVSESFRNNVTFLPDGTVQRWDDQADEIDLSPTVPFWVRSLGVQMGIAAVAALIGIRGLRMPRTELHNS